MTDELEHLIREQAADDTFTTQPQKISGGRTVPLEATETVNRLDTFLTDTAADPALVYERNTEPEADTSRTDWVSALIETLPEKQQEVYRLHMVERMSFAQIADELNITKQAAAFRLDSVKRAVAAEAERRGLYR